MVANQQIREAAKKAGVKLWEVAEAVGITDSNFSRKLRRELPQAEAVRILDIIDALAAEKTEVT